MDEVMERIAVALEQIAENTAPAPARNVLGEEITLPNKIVSYNTEVADTATHLDSMGIPWDDRIHASSKAILKDTGQWKSKRGVDPELLKQVQGELLRMLQPVQEVEESPVEETSTIIEEPEITGPVDAPSEATQQDVITVFKELMAVENGPTLGRKLLDEYAAPTLKDVKPEQYSAFILNANERIRNTGKR